MKLVSYTLLCSLIAIILPSTRQNELTDWIESKGGWAHLSVGPVNEGGLRGTLATRDIAEGDTLAYIPKELVIQFGAPGNNRPPENAARLLGRQRREAGWHAAFLPYWRSLPALGSPTLFCKELFTERHIALLQDPGMEWVVREEIATAVDIYNGTSTWWQRLLGLAPPVSLHLNLPKGAEHDVTWEEFAHTTCLVGAYAFGCRGGWGGSQVCMVPLLDMINHAHPDTANTVVHQDTRNGSYGCTAIKNITAGQEVTHTYSATALRSDYSLLHYGFVLEMERPLLAGNDHIARFEYSDDDLYSQHERLLSHEEAQRLNDILKSFPTTEEEDLQLLRESSDKLDGREREIIRFRIQRKRALRQMPLLGIKNKFEMINKELIAEIELPERVNKPLPVS
ncbi:g2162 [Coccomyxa elongata]